MTFFSTLIQVLQIIAPVFFLAGIGFIWVKIGLDYPVQFVTRITMTLAIPCLIFMALASSEIDHTALRDTAIAAFCSYGAVGLIVAAVLKFMRHDQRTFLAPLVFGNTGNLGLPLALYAFGAVGFDFAVVVFAVMILMSFTFGVWVVAGANSLLVTVKEPLVWATLLGAMFLIFEINIPVWSANTLELIGQMGIPLMLITLGAAISRLQPAALGRAVWMSGFKYLVCVSVPVGVGLLFNLPPLAFVALVLQVATPVAVSNFMLAEKYGANSSEVAGLVVVSTIFSIVAIPLTLAFLI